MRDVVVWGTLLTSTVAAVAVVACSASGTAPSVDAGAEAGIELPSPTGPYAIGTQRRVVVDTSRTDPQAPDPTSSRTLLVTLFYPTDAGERGPLAPYMMPAEALSRTSQGWFHAWPSLPPFPSGWEKDVVVHARDSVALSSGGAKFPVVLYSHGFGRAVPDYTSLVEELASHGFVVAAVSHLYDADVTELPDGAVAYPNTAWQGAYGTLDEGYDAHVAVWVADAHFVLDQLTAWDANDPQGLLSGRLDLDHVGYFGHSYGGATAAEACALDPRVKAGINLDGTFYSPIRHDGGRAIPTPFLIQLNQGHATVEAGFPGENSGPIDDSVPNTYGLLQDAGYEVRIANCNHPNFGDIPMLADKFDGLEAGQPSFGTIDPRRALSIINAYDLAFFQKHLKGTAEPLLDGPTPYPEVTFTKR